MRSRGKPESEVVIDVVLLLFVGFDDFFKVFEEIEGEMTIGKEKPVSVSGSFVDFVFCFLFLALS